MILISSSSRKEGRATEYRSISGVQVRLRWLRECTRRCARRPAAAVEDVLDARHVGQRELVLPGGGRRGVARAADGRWRSGSRKRWRRLARHGARLYRRLDARQLLHVTRRRHGRRHCARRRRRRRWRPTRAEFGRSDLIIPVSRLGWMRHASIAASRTQVERIVLCAVVRISIELLHQTPASGRNRRSTRWRTGWCWQHTA